MNIEKRLYDLQDKTYRDFQARLVPTIDKATIIGVRVPVLRKLAKEIIKNNLQDDFIADLPHTYYDENILHGIIISDFKSYPKTIDALDAFLPYVDNWAVCDIISPKTFKDTRDKLIGEIYRWLETDHLYTRRFALVMLMKHYLKEDFDPKYLDLVTDQVSEGYYLDMAVAWYMATALACQWDHALEVLETKALPAWVHNKSIQKAIESRRITEDQKAYLRGLKI